MFDTANTAERNAATAEAMNDPQVGDRFHEMYSFFVYVVFREKDKIVTLEASPPCTLPEDGTLKSQTVQQFQERFSYGTIDGYWVSLCDRGNNVEGWMDAAKVEAANENQS